MDGCKVQLVIQGVSSKKVLDDCPYNGRRAFLYILSIFLSHNTERANQIHTSTTSYTQQSLGSGIQKAAFFFYAQLKQLSIIVLPPTTAKIHDPTCKQLEVELREAQCTNQFYNLTGPADAASFKELQ